MPNRWDPHTGYFFTPNASRQLGAGLLTISWAGVQYIRRFYYLKEKMQSLTAQRNHFFYMLLAIGLISSAFLSAEPIGIIKDSTEFAEESKAFTK